MTKYFLAALACAAGMFTATVHAAPLNSCDVVEYAELKDMDTETLVMRIDTYHSNSKFLQIQRGAATAREASDISEAQNTCRKEAQRIAAIANKRKDLGKTLMCDAECQKYAFLRKPEARAKTRAN